MRGANCAVRGDGPWHALMDYDTDADWLGQRQVRDSETGLLCSVFRNLGNKLIKLIS